MARQPRTRQPKAKYNRDCFICHTPVTRLVIRGKIHFKCDCSPTVLPHPQPAPSTNPHKNGFYTRGQQFGDLGPPAENVRRTELGYKGIDPVDMDW